MSSGPMNIDLELGEDLSLGKWTENHEHMQVQMKVLLMEK